MELAKEILGGKYEFVLTTHIDKNHIHNHLIFNAVSFTDYKHYHSNKRSYHEIRSASDRICKEHDLSVIIPGKDRGKSYIEHQAVRIMNFLTEHWIENYAELETRLAAVTGRQDSAHTSLKETETRIAELSLVMKHAGTYRSLKPLYEQYRHSKDKEKFLRGHESGIIIFEAAARELKKLGGGGTPAVCGAHGKGTVEAHR